MARDHPASDDENRVTIAFTEPYCRPGTPEAHRHGCLCGFESNLRASIVAAERNPDTAIVVIHKDCPLHKIIQDPVGPKLDLGGQSKPPPE